LVGVYHSENIEHLKTRCLSTYC